MRVCVIGYNFDKIGGIEKLSREVIDIMRNNNIEYKSIKYKRVDKYLLSIFIYIYRIIYKDVVYMYMHPYLFEKHPTRKNGVVWAHGKEVWGNYGKSKTLKLKYSQKVLAVSQYTKKQLELNHEGLSIEVVNLYASNNFKSPRVIKRDTKVFRLITVSRLSSQAQYKGHDMVLEALSQFKKYNDLLIEYNIIGDGDDRDRLMQLVNDMNLDNNVNFLGYMPDDKISSMYYNSDVFVMPSRVTKSDNQIWGGEGFGLVYLEAGLHKLPVIACDEGGQVDCIINGVTGYLIKPSIEELTELLSKLGNKKKSLKIMGEEGYKLVKKNFNKRRFEKKLLEVIYDLNNNNPN